MAGIWRDLIGTVYNTLRIGFGKSTLDASAITAPRTHALPDASGTLALTTYETVSTLPAASANANKTLAQGGTLWYSNGTTWIDLGASGGGGISDGDKGDVVVSGSGSVWTVDNGAVGLPKLGATAVAAFAPVNHVGSGGSAGVGGDADYAKVSLLHHYNGTNGSTTFLDNSSFGHVFTASGNAQISTVQNKFGGASAIFDGAGDFLSLSANAAFDVGALDFCVEAQIYPTNSAAGADFSGQLYQGIFGQYQLGATSNSSIVLTLRDMRVYALVSFSGSFSVILSSLSALPVNAWSHIAFVRYSSSFFIFVNGLQVASAVQAGAIDTSTRVVRIGADAIGVGSFEGYIDELRVTKGAPRYTANFAPPSVQFDDASVTVHAVATQSFSGFMSKDDKIKLDGTNLIRSVTITYPSQGASVITRDITVAGATVGQKVIATPSLAMPSGVAQDELEMDMLSCAGAVIAANTVRLIVSSFNGAIISGQRNINIQLSN